MSKLSNIPVFQEGSSVDGVGVFWLGWGTCGGCGDAGAELPQGLGQPEALPVLSCP